MRFVGLGCGEVLLEDLLEDPPALQGMSVKIGELKVLGVVAAPKSVGAPERVIPLSVEMPAPVKATICRAPLMREAASLMLSWIFLLTGLVSMIMLIL